MIKLSLQIATKAALLPSKKQLKTWLNLALKSHYSNGEVLLRIVSPEEIQALNSQYRHKNKPTNILSFPYDPDFTLEPNSLIGDLIICPRVLEEEAKRYHLDLETHWAHIVIHGALHLVGYDHLTSKERKIMEALEAELLEKLEYTRP